MPKVSVLIPTYNQGRYIADSIQSVTNQTFQDYEIIILDNCSTDNTQDVTKNFLVDGRIRYVRNEINIGGINNFNEIIKLAQGEYIKYLFSDDLLKPLALEEFVKVMDNNLNVSLVTSYFEHFGSLTLFHKQPETGLINGYRVIEETIISSQNWIGAPSNVLFRRKDFDNLGFRKEWKYITDLELWHRILLKGDLYVIPRFLSMFRNHEQSATNDCQLNYDDLHDFYYYLKYINDFDLYSPLKEDKEFQNRLALNAKVWVGMIPTFYYQKNYSYLRKSLKAVLEEGLLLEVTDKGLRRMARKIKELVFAS